MAHSKNCTLIGYFSELFQMAPSVQVLSGRPPITVTSRPVLPVYPETARRSTTSNLESWTPSRISRTEAPVVRYVRCSLSAFSLVVRFYGCDSPPEACLVLLFLKSPSGLSSCPHAFHHYLVRRPRAFARLSRKEANAPRRSASACAAFSLKVVARSSHSGPSFAL